MEKDKSYYQQITQLQALRFEIASSRFTGYISSERIQSLLAKYYAWKIEKKYKRYLAHMEFFNQHTNK